jgi:hypothetical protein
MPEIQESRVVTRGVFMVTRKKDGTEFRTRIGYAIKNDQKTEVRVNALPMDGKFIIDEEDSKAGSLSAA